MKVVKPEQITLLKQKPEDTSPEFIKVAQRVKVGYGLVITHKEWDKKTRPVQLINIHFKDRKFKSKNMGSYYLLERVK